MKQRKLLNKKVKKPNIPFRRKVAIIYGRIKIATKIFVLFFLYLLFFTNYLNFIRYEIAQNIYELTADIGFKLENVLIEGQQNAQSEDILATLNADTGTPIFAINLNEIQAQLQKNSWIKAASVERRMPSTIYITLLERTPIAIWQINKKFFLIDEEGYKITETNLEKFADLLHVVGSDANVYASKLIKDLTKYPELSTKILSAVRYGERRWNLNFQQNITIKMPEVNFDNALNYIAELNKAGKLFNQGYKSLDLRDPDKYYIEKF
jgi:cell division protein FtsQ